MRTRMARVAILAAVVVVGGLADFHPQAQVSAVKSPRKIKDVKPIYPAKSLLAGDEGAVVLELKIDGAGSVTDARVIWSKCPALNDSALRAARAWRYEILRINGQPTAFLVRAQVPFRLPQELKLRTGPSGGCKWVDPPKPTR
jgi:TonB family protein